MRRSLVDETLVVVTGGRGFVGSALLARAQRAGSQVASYDLRDGLDICDPSALGAALEPGDTVVHLAAYADLYVAREHPVDCVRVNVMGTTLVAEAARQRGARLILGSALCVYGNQPNYPTPEDTRPNPSEIYIGRSGRRRPRGLSRRAREPARRRGIAGLSSGGGRPGRTWAARERELISRR